MAYGDSRFASKYRYDWPIYDNAATTTDNTIIYTSNTANQIGAYQPYVVQSVPLTDPLPPPGPEKPEEWLRRRVKEVLWQEDRAA